MRVGLCINQINTKQRSESDPRQNKDRLAHAAYA